MAACVEIWESDPEALHYHGSGYVALGPRGAGGRAGRGVRAPAADRLPLRAPHRRERRSRAHARALPRLARGGPDRVPARAGGRLRLQPGVDAGPGGQGASRRRADLRGGRGHRLPRSTARARRRRWRRARGPIEVEQVVVAVGPWIARLWEPARASPTGSTCAIPTARSSAMPRCGRTGTCRRARSSWRPRRSTRPRAARAPCFTWTRIARSATTTAPWSARGPGGSTSSPTASRSRAGPSRLRLGHEHRARPVPDGHGRARLPGPVVRGALALHGAVRGLPRELRPGPLGRGGRLHAPTTSRSSTACATTSTSPRTRTTATR